MREDDILFLLVYFPFCFMWFRAVLSDGSLEMFPLRVFRTNVSKMKTLCFDQSC